MGQKVHPESLRVGYIHDWKSTWFNEKEFSDYLMEDIEIREHIENKLAHAGLSTITIKKNKNEVEVNIHTARPGIVIGKSGSEVDALRKELHKMTGKAVKVNILEIKRPELDARLVAQSIAEQLQNRVAFRRAMKRALTSAMRSGAKGVKIQVSGRLGGAEMARTEGYSDGRVPLHTLRADIDYGFYEARTTFGRIGVKVWINKGEIMPKGFAAGPDRARGAPDRRPRWRSRPGRPGWPRRRSRAGRRPWPGWPRRRSRSRRAWRSRRRRRAAPEEQALMLQPKRVKWRKEHRGRRRGYAKGGTNVEFGEYGLKATRARLGHQPPDRGRPCRDDAQDQAWREGVDQHLPRQALHEEAGRDPHGLGQGHAGGLGRRGQARARDVRAVGRAGGPRARGDAARRPQASRQDQVRLTRWCGAVDESR